MGRCKGSETRVEAMMKVWLRWGTAALLTGAVNAALGQQSAGEVEQLKKQNADLQQRVDKLAGELDSIKAQLAEKLPVLAKKSSGSGLGIEFYGYVKLDAAYDTARVSIGDYARWVESEQGNPHDNEFNLTANETRVGVRLRGPVMENFRSSGQVELDFYGGGAENSPFPRLRQANLSFDWPSVGFGVLAGQANDVISPLWMPRVNFSPGWWQGNIGYRRPQLRLTQNLSLAEDVDLKFEAAAVRTIAETFTTPRDSFFDPGADAGFPTAQGRVSLTFPGPGRQPITLGVSGHWGEEEHDFTNFVNSVTFKTWSGNVDLTLPLTPWLSLRGEAYLGSDLGAYLGGIGQGVNPTLLRPIRDRGGWAAATLGPFGPWAFNLGYGIDDVRRRDLTANLDPTKDPRAQNWVAFGNVYYSLNPNLQLALEVARMRTTYKSVAPGDDWRTQFAIIYKF
jgi:hypothetical protein